MNDIIDSLLPLAVPIDSIREDPRNARKHDKRNLDVIKKSLETYGQRKPVVCQGDGTIEAGNGLYRAAKELGWTQVAVVKVNDDPDYAKGYALVDNKSAELSEWSLPELKDVLQELDTGAFDMDATGFDQAELERMMTAYHAGRRFDAAATPTTEGIAAREGQLAKAFVSKCDTEAKSHIELICPECGASFSVRKDDLEKQSSV
jgi:ParB-like chromosome segregation protein Spo0J